MPNDGADFTSPCRSILRAVLAVELAAFLFLTLLLGVRDPQFPMVQA
jgi:hypothetical protein